MDIPLDNNPPPTPRTETPDNTLFPGLGLWFSGGCSLGPSPGRLLSGVLTVIRLSIRTTRTDKSGPAFHNAVNWPVQLACSSKRSVRTMPVVGSACRQRRYEWMKVRLSYL